MAFRAGLESPVHAIQERSGAAVVAGHPSLVERARETTARVADSGRTEQQLVDLATHGRAWCRHAVSHPDDAPPALIRRRASAILRALV